jgi:hypothetical protein
MQYYSIVDFIYAPVILFVIVLLARIRKYRLIETRPEYKYFTKGLYVKLFGGIFFVIIYTLYYGGGDTVNYFSDSTVMMRLLFSNPYAFFDVMANSMDYSKVHYFNEDTGYLVYVKDDPQTFFVVRMATPFTILGGGSIMVTTIIFATFSFMGIWKLYRLFVMEFPDLKKEMAIAILFIPSVFFWGSGIMKDTITLSCIGFYSYSFYMIFIKKEKIPVNVFTILFSTYLILSVKPYIIFALLPGSFIWLVSNYLTSIDNKVVKTLIGPLMLTIAGIGGYFMLVGMGDVLGSYSVDKVLERAVVTNQDLKADYYGGNSFDIGDFDPTVPSMLAKAPAAINVALFRPYLWEARNPVMLLSGLEGFIILLITFRMLIKVKVVGVFKIMNKNHLLLFSLIFSLFFAFSVGISTSNFGSLVRYRIPSLPFFLASIYIIEYIQKKKKEEESAVPFKVPAELPDGN